MDSSFEVITLQDKDGQEHCAVGIPRTLSGLQGYEKVLPRGDVYNLILIDGSEQMMDYWPHLVSAWNRNIADKLEGRTNLYIFGDYVPLIRPQPKLRQEDLKRNQRRNFTGSLRLIRQRVGASEETHIRIFIVISGPHDANEQFPEEEIIQLTSCTGKNVVVYIIGIGKEFPAHHCLEIQSKLSTGNENNDTFFKAESINDIEEQCSRLGDILKPFIARLELSKETFMLPGSHKKTASVHLGEWVYFEEPLSQLKPLSLKVNEDLQIDITGNIVTGNKTSALVDLFTQWNKVLFQKIHEDKYVPPNEMFGRIISFYSYCKSKHFKKLSKQETKDRKTFLHLENLFRRKKNQIMPKGEEMKNDFSSADSRLSTSVCEPDVKKIQWKYCSPEKFRKAMDSFKSLYENIKPRIMALTPPHPDECCRITKTSTLSTLMEEDFENVFQEEKCYFLKNFTMSGIPVFALKSSTERAQKNPWAMGIKHILLEPYGVMSQQGLEYCAANGEGCVDHENKAAKAEPSKENTKFNVIVPTVPARAADVLKPLVQSDLYAITATFCILKNPSLVDFYAHFAALGCVWLESLKQNPGNNRPEFISNRLNDIENTAKLYLDKRCIANYINVLLDHPKEALMFESNLKSMNKPIRCESLVKPVFLLYLMKEALSNEVLAETFRYIVLEFIRRCLMRKGRCSIGDAPFTEFFCSHLSSLDQRRKWIEDCCKEIIKKKKHSYKKSIDRFYTLQELRKTIRKDVASGMTAEINKLTFGISMKKVQSLKNIYSCGGIMWSTFEIFTREFDLPGNPANDDSALLFVTAVLNEKEPRKHLPDVPKTPDAALNIIKKRISTEILATLTKDTTTSWSFETEIVEEWKNKLKEVHNNTLAHPMTQRQIIAEAQEQGKRGIEVTDDTFKKVYKYDECTKLLRNACQIRNCRYYLKPCENFNQHLSQAKAVVNCPESLHWTTSRFKDHGPERIRLELLSRNRNPPGGRRSRPSHEDPTVSEDMIKELIAMYEQTEKL